MSQILMRILDLVAREKIRVSEHGYGRLAEDDINMREVVQGVREGQLIEEYPDYAKGPCVLVLQRDRQGKAIHLVWGIPRGWRFTGGGSHRLSPRSEPVSR